MTRRLWKTVESDLKASYPNAELRDVMPDGSRVVFEVPA
jgi:hypothetical protein